MELGTLAPADDARAALPQLREDDFRRYAAVRAFIDDFVVHHVGEKHAPRLTAWYQAAQYAGYLEDLRRGRPASIGVAEFDAMVAWSSESFTN